MIRWRKSITLRLTLLFAAASTAVLLTLGLLIGNAVEQHFVEQDMELMTGKLHLAGYLLEKVRTTRDLDTLGTQLDDSLVGHHGLSMLVRSADQRTFFATYSIVFTPSLMARDDLKGVPQPLAWQQ